MKILILTGISSILLCHTMHAAVVIPNLAAAGNGFSFSVSGPNASIGGFILLPDREIAFSVTTGNTAAKLDSLKIVMNNQNGSSPLNVTMGQGNLPGTTNRTLIFSKTLGMSSGTIAFDQQNSPTLAANTSSWFHLTGTGAALATVLSRDVAPDYQGSGWTMNYVHAKNGPTDPWQASLQYARIELSATAVPEPRISCLGALATFIFLLKRKKPLH